MRSWDLDRSLRQAFWTLEIFGLADSCLLHLLKDPNLNWIAFLTDLGISSSHCFHSSKDFGCRIVLEINLAFLQAMRSTPDTLKPIFISVGHRISLDSAVMIVKVTCKYRVPEPIRQVKTQYLLFWLTTRVVHKLLRICCYFTSANYLVYNVKDVLLGIC